MPVYFGLPVTCKEAYRLFGQNYNQTELGIIEKHRMFRENPYTDPFMIEHLNKFFQSIKLLIRIFYTDKGQCIIGYIIDEPSDVSNKFVDVDKFITILTDLKARFAVETSGYSWYFNRVTLERMENEPVEILGPITPYIIEYNN
jgi:hypothetical protein